MTDKILTLHPQGKKGTNISRERYDAVRDAIIDHLGRREMTAFELFAAAGESLGPGFDGSVNWYGEGVKLGIKARKVLERLPGKRPLYRLAR